MTLQVDVAAQGWRGHFQAMASPCEVLLRGGDLLLARRVAGVVHDEALRIERKFSRYRQDNIVHAINNAGGAWVEVDEETERLLDYADQCWRISDGCFDISSGVLRRVWRFDGSDRVPDADAVAAVLADLGWDKVERRAGAIRLQPGMEVDFGGIGKEYAVDRALDRARALTEHPMLVNFGGDIAAHSVDGQPFVIGLEDVSAGAVAGRFHMTGGGLATSGDSRRYLLKDGVRYSHVLDPRTGWPVRGGPRSVTVAAQHCIQAGTLATLALLHGDQAEKFLHAQGVRYWCQWQERTENA